VEPATAVELLARDHFTFLFAQAYHPAMRHVAPVRRALATPTIFNVLGPLVNPAHLTFQLMGVWDPNMLDMIAEAMVQLERKRALVVHGSGLDEIAVHGPTLVREATPDGVRAYEVTPEDLGVTSYELADPLGGEPAGPRRRYWSMMLRTSSFAAGITSSSNHRLRLRQPMVSGEGGTSGSWAGGGCS